MTNIRKFVYATLLALSALSFAPTLSSAQEPARGQFRLPHDVHWQNAVVPAGDYRFSFEADGAMGMLTLSRMSGGRRAGFVFLVSNTDEAKPSDVSLLVLETTPEGSYVSTMQLPEFGMTLHFPVPSHATEKQIAKVATAPLASGQ
jgi:hypothetical protein